MRFLIPALLLSCATPRPRVAVEFLPEAVDSNDLVCVRQAAPAGDVYLKCGDLGRFIHWLSLQGPATTDTEL